MEKVTEHHTGKLLQVLVFVLISDKFTFGMGHVSSMGVAMAGVRAMGLNDVLPHQFLC